jgi:hypothetical protein
MTRTFDFRPGTKRWGHALHAETWREAPPRVTGHLWWRKSIPRVSFMVHAWPPPRPNDLVLYRGSLSDEDKTAVIVEVKPCFDPRDMFTLVVEAAP